MTTKAIQTFFRPALTMVGANKDYWQFRKLLERIDEQIKSTSLESVAVDFAISKIGVDISAAPIRFAIFSLRAELLRTVLGVPSFRDFSKSLASSDLYAVFCGIRGLEGIRWFGGTT